jgi:hypothetical protein
MARSGRTRPSSRARAAARHGVARAAGVLIALAWLPCGCLALRYADGSPIAQEQVARLRPGETTKAEVLSWFGAPQGFSDANVVRRLLAEMNIDIARPVELPFSDVLVFQYVKGQMNAQSFVVYTSVEVRTVADTLVVFFDTDDRVAYYGFREGTRALEQAE